MEKQEISLDYIKQKLTSKQILFCNYILQGDSQTEAYMKASGNMSMNRSSARSSGSRYMQNEYIQMYIKILKNKSMEIAVETIDIGKIILEHYKAAIDPSNDNEMLKKQSREWFLKAFQLDEKFEERAKEILASQYEELKTLKEEELFKIKKKAKSASKKK